MVSVKYRLSMKQTNKPKKSDKAASTAAAGLPRHGLPREGGQVLLLYSLTAVALCWIFPPYGVWPLALVCLVPWTVATCRTHRAWLVHWLSFFIGWAFFLVALRWLMPVTGLGYAALGVYLAIYWTLAAWAIRTGRRHGISPMWSLPVVWVACEYLRGTVMTGFPWLFISHGFFRQLPLIQISDITGAYGVSFLAALVNGVLVELVLRRWPAPGSKISTRQLWLGGIVTVVLLLVTLGYGYFRLNQVDFERTPESHGPRVAVIQEDFPLASTPPYSAAPPQVVLATYLSRAAEAARREPDLIVFPETVWSAIQNLSFIEVERAAIDNEYADTWLYGNLCHVAVSALARGDYPTVNVQISQLERPSMKLPRLPAEGGPPVTVVVGSVSIEQFPEATYPKEKRYNSALVYDPDGTQRRLRYDKRHLVPFGEFVPFRYGCLRWLYLWLNSLSPFSHGGRVEYSLTPGEQFTVFELQVEDQTYTFGTPICYEDVTPYVIREFTWDGPRRRADFLLNISNDGWFHHRVGPPPTSTIQRPLWWLRRWFWQSNELPQHLAICAFRAVENRVSIARAVNTGISGFIDPNGRIYSRVLAEDGRSFGPGVVGYDLEHVYLDRRTSLYGRFGDWFAGVCVLLTCLLWLGAVFERWVLALKHKIESLLRKGG
ncbi:MAG: hypothetical protein KAY37_13705 [Phycisphaerae bacterium]|nr:hypothetical protein [Phycisphaerae bacterium]